MKLLVTADLPYLLCGMSSVGTRAQVFPLQKPEWRGGKDQGGRGEKEEKERRKCKREHPANVDMSEALKSPITQWDGRIPLKRVRAAPRAQHHHTGCSRKTQRSQPSVWKHKLMKVTADRLQKGILLLTDLYQVKIWEGERQRAGKECSDTFSPNLSHYNYSDVNFWWLPTSCMVNDHFSCHVWLTWKMHLLHGDAVLWPQIVTPVTCEAGPLTEQQEFAGAMMLK